MRSVAACSQLPVALRGDGARGKGWSQKLGQWGHEVEKATPEDPFSKKIESGVIPGGLRKALGLN